MQDFWLLNGFFLALGLVYITIALVFIFGTRQRGSRVRPEPPVKTSKPVVSRKTVGYNFLATGVLISLTAAILLLLGQAVNLLVLAAINLAVTFTALRINLFHDAESAYMPTIRNNETEQFTDQFPQDQSTITILEEIIDTPLIVEEISQETPIEANRKPYVEISPELFAELAEISSDPAAAVDEAIRWWLRRRIVEQDSDRPNRRSLRSSESWRSQQQSWND
ncbi:hypothetical protein [Pseudanabaena mucicola]|uniref:Uncharacterized protein n=1 Tax=Pseudanabaena mucicola FACHB-723 TaxID=2692860 RepID=A0ABR7ZXI0_9CYAN|nr:hypothetical protein [Pseudanabaena mucicola]MBD2188244.1 hypothetical protein [Pseudanabaena mucicola FACHB-723]